MMKQKYTILLKKTLQVCQKQKKQNSYAEIHFEYSQRADKIPVFKARIKLIVTNFPILKERLQMKQIQRYKNNCHNSLRNLNEQDLVLKKNSVKHVSVKF